MTISTPEDVPPALPAQPLSAQQRAAIASVFLGDAERIMSVAFRFQAERRIIESTVGGTSMDPMLVDGARIRIELTQDDCRMGEVIAFLAGTQVVVHRLVRKPRLGKSQRYLIFQGDARWLPDPPVLLSRVLGPVVGVQYKGTWLDFDQQPPPKGLAAIVTSGIARSMESITLALSPAAALRLVTLLRRCGRSPILLRLRPSSPVRHPRGP